MVCRKQSYAVDFGRRKREQSLHKIVPDATSALHAGKLRSREATTDCNRKGGPDLIPTAPQLKEQYRGRQAQQQQRSLRYTRGTSVC